MSETIAALATAAHPSAIGILRLSGDRAVETAAAVFRPEDGRPLEHHDCRKLIYGTLLGSDGATIDKALATFSRAPHSYTGEDTAELQCHGSPTVLALGLDALFSAGARQAGPGEFTRRAFLNGKLDLTQAEAVADLIDAETPAAVHQAAGQLSGALSRRVRGIYDGLVDLLAHFHAVLDYPDEDIDPFRAETISAALDRALAEMGRLLESYRRGRYIAGGVPCAIVGRPNAGKSSLLNALVGYERAIVTSIPGTTRDTVEERCQLGGVLLRLIDTAGMRDTEDAVERLGVQRSRAALEGAALALVLIDSSGEITTDDLEILQRACDAAPQVLLVFTKADLAPTPAGTVGGTLPDTLPPAVAVSALTGQGLGQLETAIAALFPTGGDAEGERLSNARQAEAAQRARAAVLRAQAGLAAHMTPDAVLTDAEEAVTALGELTGKNLHQDVTARIFERFCVGK